MLTDGDTFEHKGNAFVLRVHHDTDYGAPWLEDDGHGPVSEWRSVGYTGRPAKAPGELILCRDRGSYRTYDFAEACRIALRDGWDAPPYGTGTKRQRAARAAMADFERLRAWCNDEWYWVGLEVSIPDTDISASLWGIESDDYAYHADVARELADECLAQVDTLSPAAA